MIDTGILNHADLAGRTVQGYDFISDSRVANDGNGRDNNPSDPGDWITSAENASGYFAGCGVRNSSWHGTHVAGTIGEDTGNGVGVTGLAYNSKLIPVRVLDRNLSGRADQIALGIRFAARKGADVINMSFNFPCDASVPDVDAAIRFAYKRGAVIVA